MAAEPQSPARRVVVREVPSLADFESPFTPEAFVAVVWACDADQDGDQQHQWLTNIIQAGCRYFVCGGVACSDWDDAADMAFVMLDLDHPGQTPSVMTTWHTDESVEEVLFFAFDCIAFQGYDFQNFLVLITGQDPAARSRMRQEFDQELAFLEAGG